MRVREREKKRLLLLSNYCHTERVINFPNRPFKKLSFSSFFIENVKKSGFGRKIYRKSKFFGILQKSEKVSFRLNDVKMLEISDSCIDASV